MLSAARSTAWLINFNHAQEQQWDMAFAQLLTWFKACYNSLKVLVSIMGQTPVLKSSMECGTCRMQQC
jgi:hypothetical protein